MNKIQMEDMNRVITAQKFYYRYLQTFCRPEMVEEITPETILGAMKKMDSLGHKTEECLLVMHPTILTKILSNHRVMYMLNLGGKKLFGMNVVVSDYVSPNSMLIYHPVKGIKIKVTMMIRDATLEPFSEERSFVLGYTGEVVDPNLVACFQERIETKCYHCTGKMILDNRIFTCKKCGWNVAT